MTRLSGSPGSFAAPSWLPAPLLETLSPDRVRPPLALLPM